jgi:hypothetical protein
MPATVNLRKIHTTRQHGDLLVVFTWINEDRAMVLGIKHSKESWACACPDRSRSPKYAAAQNSP